MAWMLMNFIGKQGTSPLRRRKQVFGTRWLSVLLRSRFATLMQVRNRSPLTLSSAAASVYDLAGGNQTSVDDSPLFEPRLTRISLDADDLRNKSG